jgi:hypothetical protein
MGADTTQTIDRVTVDTAKQLGRLRRQVQASSAGYDCETVEESDADLDGV